MKIQEKRDLLKRVIGLSKTGGELKVSPLEAVFIEKLRKNYTLINGTACGYLIKPLKGGYFVVSNNENYYKHYNQVSADVIEHFNLIINTPGYNYAYLKYTPLMLSIAHSGHYALKLQMAEADADIYAEIDRMEANDKSKSQKYSRDPETRLLGLRSEKTIRVFFGKNITEDPGEVNTQLNIQGVDAYIDGFAVDVKAVSKKTAKYDYIKICHPDKWEHTKANLTEIYLYCVYDLEDVYYCGYITKETVLKYAEIIQMDNGAAVVAIHEDHLELPVFDFTIKTPVIVPYSHIKAL